MYKKLSKSLTSICISCGAVEENQREVYEYGFEILVSTVLYSLIFLVTAVLTATVSYSLLFWLSFLIVRKTSGGYHARTYISCHLLFFLTHISFIALIKLLSETWLLKLAIIELLISAALILIFSPVDHPNKPFINNEENKYRRLSLINCFVLCGLVIFLVFVRPESNYYIFSYGFGTLIAAISAMSAKILKNRRKKT